MFIRILDIDLDFFQDEIVYDITDNKRASEEINVWSISQVDTFFSDNLNIDYKIPGKAFKSHEQVYYEIRRLFKKHKINDKIDFVHLDAHSDIGEGMSEWHDIVFEYLNNPPNILHPAKKIVNFGNYIIFIWAMGILCKYTNLTHKNQKDDLNDLFFVNNERRKDIQLKSFDKKYKNMDFEQLKDKKGKILYQPITFIEQLGLSYTNNKKWDYIFITKSPGYTPKKSDLIYKHIINKYVK